MNIDRLCPGCMSDNGGEAICPTCGYDMSSKNDNACLPVKFLLSQRYIIGKVISVNTEGVTYLAWDNASSTAVHVKEFFPKGLSMRNPDKTVSVISGKEFYFNEGLMDFIEINKKLIATEIQAVIPVLTVFEENGTVYAVTPVISGITLSSFLDRNGGSLRWEQARPLFLPLIDTLKALHEMGIVHGGISPETIIAGRDGKLRIGGICIPRLRKASHESPAELYSGYAAIEQYGKGDGNLSAASDVYALSATLFRVLIGTVPPSAEARVTSDTLSIPSRFADELPRQVLVAIANGMQVNAQNRTVDIDAFRNELVYGETHENIRRAAVVRNAEQKSQQTESKQGKSSGVKYATVSAGITVSVLLILVLLFGLITGVVFGKPFLIFNLGGTDSNGNPGWSLIGMIFGDDDNDIENEQDISMPDLPSIGDVDPDAGESVILYETPDLLGSYYYQIEEDLDNKYDRFKISIKGKEYSDKYARGTICAQTVEAGTPVPYETEIQVTISLGPKEISVANVVGLDETSAIMELLKQGFLYENIEVVERYDVDEKPGVVLEQDPAYGDTVTAESFIRIYVNSYEGEEEDDTSSGNSSYDTPNDTRHSN